MLLFSLFIAEIGTARADQIDDYIKRQMQRLHIPGLSLAVVQDGKVIKTKGYGLANVELNVPATPTTIYQIQSMTKQFTAAGIMMLVEEGKVGLDDRIGKYLDGTPDTWKEITVRHLLMHTSGVKDYINEPTANLRLDVTEEEVFKATVPRPLNFSPGEKWSYSNTNYLLLGMIIHKVTGKPFAEFLRERIFVPLGMNDTRIVSLSEIIPNRASGYRWNGAQLQNGLYAAPSILASAGGGILSTVLDLAKWDAALYTERLLKRSSLQQMWTSGKLNNGSETGYGFGWGGDAMRGHTFVQGTGGYLTGFMTAIIRFLNDRLTVIVFTNQNGGAYPFSIAEGVARHYIPSLLPPHPQVVKVDPALYAAYTGRYEYDNDFMLTITRGEQGHLLAALPAVVDAELLPISSDTFFHTEWGVQITFVKDNRGEISGLLWKEDGQERRAPRIGPLIHSLQSQPDPDTARTQRVQALLRALAQGIQPGMETPGLTAGARKDFGSNPNDALVGLRSLDYIASQDVAERGIERHGGRVDRILYYKLVRDKCSPYLLVYLTSEGLVTDYDLVDD